MAKIKHGPIGVFDSGYGGISVLANLIESMPGESFVFLSDSKNAPYGELEPEEVLNHTITNVEILNSQAVNAVVIACNTATSAAVQTLRSKYSFPIIGMEPAVKPAVNKTGSGRVLVAATDLTLKEKKFASLIESIDHQNEIISLPCIGLVDKIEEHGPESPEVDQKIDELLEPYRSLNFDGVVLGCTHYVLVKDKWRSKFSSDTVIYDGNDGTVRQTIRMLKYYKQVISNCPPARVCIMDSSQNDDRLVQCKKLLMNQLEINKKIFMDQLHIELRKTDELCRF